MSDPRTAAQACVSRILFDDERATLSIVAMAPVYVAFVAPDKIVDGDGNLALNAQLAAGFHAAQHDGALINENARYVVCTELGGTSCGPDANPFSAITKLESGDDVTIPVGGPDDIAEALAGVSSSALLGTP